MAWDASGCFPAQIAFAGLASALDEIGNRVEMLLMLVLGHKLGCVFQQSLLTMLDKRYRPFDVCG
jgi:hypothetical protein